MAKKTGKYGHPGSSGLAQSGGINKTFGGGKGGTAASRKSTTSRVTTTGVLNNGVGYRVRTTGGDDQKTSLGARIGQPPPLRGSGPKDPKVKVHNPVRKGSR